MKLKLQFNKDILEYAWYQPVKDFYGLVVFKGSKWEFFCHMDDPDQQCDALCVFAKLPNYDPNWHATTYYDLDKEIYTKITCECGSDKHGFAGHAQWCPKWVKL